MSAPSYIGHHHLGATIKSVIAIGAVSAELHLRATTKPEARAVSTE